MKGCDCVGNRSCEVRQEQRHGVEKEAPRHLRSVAQCLNCNGHMQHGRTDNKAADLVRRLSGAEDERSEGSDSDFSPEQSRTPFYLRRCSSTRAVLCTHTICSWGRGLRREVKSCGEQ